MPGTHLIFEERCRWRDDPKPEASPEQPEISRLQLCDRLKAGHRFASVFWILANDGANLLHPPPPDEPPHLLRLGRKSQDRPRLKRKFRKKPAGAALLARWCIAIAYGQTWHHGPITGLCGAVRCVMWWHRSARNDVPTKGRCIP